MLKINNFRYREKCPFSSDTKWYFGCPNKKTKMCTFLANKLLKAVKTLIFQLVILKKSNFQLAIGKKPNF